MGLISQAAFDLPTASGCDFSFVVRCMPVEGPLSHIVKHVFVTFSIHSPAVTASHLKLEQVVSLPTTSFRSLQIDNVDNDFPQDPGCAPLNFPDSEFTNPICRISAQDRNSPPDQDSPSSKHLLNLSTRSGLGCPFGVEPPLLGGISTPSPSPKPQRLDLNYIRRIKRRLSARSKPYHPANRLPRAAAADAASPLPAPERPSPAFFWSEALRTWRPQPSLQVQRVCAGSLDLSYIRAIRRRHAAAQTAAARQAARRRRGQAAE
jgi:hypothetical protein